MAGKGLHFGAVVAWGVFVHNANMKNTFCEGKQSKLAFVKFWEVTIVTTKLGFPFLVLGLISKRVFKMDSEGGLGTFW